MKIPIDILIKVGKTELINSEQHKVLLSYDKINRLGINEWKSEFKSISNSDIVFLFKGMVTAERELKWIGGSVAGGVCIYKEIENRKIDTDYQIANWALNKTNNEYIPFGSLNHNKKNVVDYFLMKQGFTYKKELEKRNREIKLLEGKIEGLKHKLQQEKNNISDLKKRHKLSKLTGNELLQLIIDDEEKPIYYYSKELEKLVDDDETNDYYFSKIYDRFKEKEKGNINRLKRKIELRFRNNNR